MVADSEEGCDKVTTTEQPRSSSSLSSLLSAELASAERPGDVCHRASLARDYRRLGFLDSAKAETSRLFRTHPNHADVIAEKLTLVVRAGSTCELTKVLDRAKRVASPSSDLLAAIGGGLVRLRRYDEAAEPLAQMLQQGPCSDVGLHALAAFLRHGQTSYPVACMLQRFALRGHAGDAPPLLQYAMIRSMTDWDAPRARERLASLCVEAIDSYDVLLDLTIQAFRLGAWAKAIRIGNHAKRLRPGERLLDRVLLSACTFSGRWEDASAGLRASLEPVPCVHLTFRQIHAIRSHIDASRAGGAADGGLKNKTSFQGQSTVRRLNENAVLNAPADDPDALTVSAMLEGDGTPSVWEALTELDLQTAHLMVQCQPDNDALHAFVSAADGPDSWSWREVPIVLKDTADACAFRLLEHPGVCSRNRSLTARDTWEHARNELNMTFNHLEPGDDIESRRSPLDR